MFYARRTRIRRPPDRIGAAVKIDEEKLFPALQQIPGFMGAYMLGNRATGDGEFFSFWKDKEALEASRPAVNALRTKLAAEEGVVVLGVENFEVVLNTGDKIHRSATHALVREFGVDPAKLEASIELAQSILLPALRELPDFEGGFWVADRSAGRAVTVLLVSEAGLEATKERWDQVRRGSRAAQALRATASETRDYEVIARALTTAGQSS